MGSMIKKARGIGKGGEDDLIGPDGLLKQLRLSRNLGIYGIASLM